MTRFIGDVHANMDNYLNLLNDSPSIQVGDFGVGFTEVPPLPAHHRFIRGNHDNPDLCKAHPNYIPDGTVEGDMMLVGGAWSVDHATRIEGVSWWRDEELSVAEFNTMIDLYEITRPNLMVTHDCPQEISELIGMRREDTSRTRQAFSAMFSIHQPKMWIFGHHHVSFRGVVNGTKFICLAELEYLDV